MFAVILINIVISLIAAYVAWLTGDDPREAAKWALGFCFAVDLFVLFIKWVESQR